jgi:membrane-associated phospholipid phosphatase
MTTVVAIGRRYLPRGWGDLGRQLAIWLGFALVYQIVRGLVDRKPPQVAFAHGLSVVRFETRYTHRLYELTIQQFVDQRHLLEDAVTWTYWNSEFTVVGIAILWVYIRRNEVFYGFRNSILLANVLGLFGYFFFPTAPPRMLGLGFVDSHHDGLVQLLSNPYAAMPSLHAADALIVAVILFRASRNWWSKALWAAWPAWVWFAVIATGNHFWLDCLAGSLVALFAMAIVYGAPELGAPERRPAAARRA